MVWAPRAKKACVAGETSSRQWSDARSGSSGGGGGLRSICSAVIRSMQLSISERESGSRGYRPRQYSSRLSSRKSRAPTCSACSTTFTPSVDTYCAPVFSQMPSLCWRDLVRPPTWPAESNTSRSWSRRRYAAVSPATPPPRTARSSRSMSLLPSVCGAWVGNFAVAEATCTIPATEATSKPRGSRQSDTCHQGGGAGYGGLSPVHGHRSHGGIVLRPRGPRLHHRVRDHPAHQLRPRRPLHGGRVPRLAPPRVLTIRAHPLLPATRHRLCGPDDRHGDREPRHPSIRVQAAAPAIAACDPDHRTRHVSPASERSRAHMGCGHRGLPAEPPSLERLLCRSGSCDLRSDRAGRGEPSPDGRPRRVHPGHDDRHRHESPGRGP